MNYLFVISLIIEIHGRQKYDFFLGYIMWLISLDNDSEKYKIKDEK
jgi:hypothetical protein